MPPLPLLPPVLQSVRRQGMRVGQSLSRLLDPSKPPMFGEEQEQLQTLLPEEVWDESQAQQAKQTKQQGSPAAPGPAKQAAAGASSVAQRRRGQRRQAREQRRAQRRSGGGDPPEGPLTETDSDDEQGGWGSDASSVSSSGSEGSASSGGMEAYDLEESDEEDPAGSKLQVGLAARGGAVAHGEACMRRQLCGRRRASVGRAGDPAACNLQGGRLALLRVAPGKLLGKLPGRPAASTPAPRHTPGPGAHACVATFHCAASRSSFYLQPLHAHALHPPQLRDLPKMLLSGAEQDWRGQLRALRHAEYLIRAAPDELEQYAGGFAAVRRWAAGLHRGPA